MSALESKIFEFLENNQLDDFKKVFNKNSQLPESDICSIFNICMLEIDTKSDFAKYVWSVYGDLLSTNSNSSLLNSFSLYWNLKAKNFYNELKNPTINSSIDDSVSDFGTSGNYDPKFLKNIKEVRNRLSKLFEFQTGSFSKDNLKMFIDVCTLLTFKCSNTSDVLDFSQNDFIDLARTTDFNGVLKDVPFNFKSIFTRLVDFLNLENRVPANYLDELLSNPTLQEYPDANVSLNIYLLKGKFNWVSLSNSSFGYYLNNFPSLDFSAIDPSINCWEAVLYGLYKANIVSLEDLRKAYTDSEIDESVAKWFDYKNAAPISLYDWRNKLTDKSKLLLGDAYNTQKGVAHVMISVPFSEKQILKMLITKKFDEKPCGLKLYSHWNKFTDKKLGSVSKKDFDRIVSDSLSFRAKNVNSFNCPNI